jgi:hypothetical protein
MIILGLNLEQFIDFVHSYNHQIDREDQNRETFLILDRTCKKFNLKKNCQHSFFGIKIWNSYISAVSEL